MKNLFMCLLLLASTTAQAKSESTVILKIASATTKSFSLVNNQYVTGFMGYLQIYNENAPIRGTSEVYHTNFHISCAVTGYPDKSYSSFNPYTRTYAPESLTGFVNLKNGKNDSNKGTPQFRTLEDCKKTVDALELIAQKRYAKYEANIRGEGPYDPMFCAITLKVDLENYVVDQIDDTCSAL